MPKYLNLSFSGSITPSYVNGFFKGERLTIKMNHLRLGRVRNKKKRDFPWGLVGWEVEACA
jgi:hypothetical protein